VVDRHRPDVAGADAGFKGGTDDGVLVQPTADEDAALVQTVLEQGRN
jgi:hypothetical protein